MRGALAGVLLVALLLAACSESVPPAGPPIVVAAPESEKRDALFAEFTRETGIPVIPKWGASADNTAELIAKRGQQADVLMTDTVGDIWRAAEEGALRPIRSAAFDAAPELLKDADRYWAATAIKPVSIVVAKREGEPAALDFAALGEQQIAGRLCLSSSSLGINRTLIAMLINDLGVKPTERLVRRWVSNLAAPPFANEAALVTAMRQGVCDYGIVAWRAEDAELMSLTPAPVYADIDGIGVARHATEPDGANRFVDWMLQKSSSRVSGALERRAVGIAGFRGEEARLLAERAAYP